MASTSTVLASMPLYTGNQRRFKALPVRPSKAAAVAKGKFEVRASLKEKAVVGLTAAALTASMMAPEVAEAAGYSGLTPSLNNFLLSIAAGGIVLAAILGAVIGVSNFDPVKRS